MFSRVLQVGIGKRRNSQMFSRGESLMMMFLVHKHGTQRCRDSGGGGGGGQIIPYPTLVGTVIITVVEIIDSNKTKKKKGKVLGLGRGTGTTVFIHLGHANLPKC